MKIPAFAVPMIFAALAFPAGAYAAAQASLSVSPQAIIQGDPVMIQVSGASLSSVRSVSFGGKILKTFLFEGKPTAFAAIGLSGKTGTTTLVAKLSGGKTLSESIGILARLKEEAPLGIPAKLGGDTPASQKSMVDTLAAENKTLAGLHTGTKAFWTKPFLFPVSDPIVTDPYGYTRLTGAYSIAHKGTDFHAPIGTPVMAMNRGVVRIAKLYKEYGNTIVVDHGLGLMTFYMHLSKMNVRAGDLVERGEKIGLSGDTGYAAQPHLHLTVRINDVSIDPMEFMRFFQ